MAKDNKSNKQYSKEFKESVIKRLESSPDETVPKLSEELGIAKSTIYQWIKSTTPSNNLNSRPNYNVVGGVMPIIL